ncbi:ATP-binding cassette domain-containing protein [Epibacterium sp. SM1979]|uniref:ATP-binding cassette domain-containing protein n=1 Tax=Tritonibacter litoralis TaxID=2662264 RepID=A0A843YFN7_9RHOB|nr:ABC transporter ATP-binding protein [Tritonibacter litoralis]MQQ10300.1 ATP-binding cassette domain-containing protein [Tritonibacter litoralis]
MFQLTDVSATFADRRVLEVTKLDLAADEITVLLGHNGSGKSTLMAGLARQVNLAGSIAINGHNIHGFSARSFAREVAHMPQNLPPAPGLTLRDMVLLARYPWRGPLRPWTETDFARVEEAIAAVGMAPFADVLVDELSGGERQRGWIAALVAQDAPFALLDEPLSALDIPYQFQVLEVIRGLNRTQGIGIMMILHDVNLAAAFADRVIALSGGRVVFDDRAEKLMQADVLQRIYGIEPHILLHPSRQTSVAVF